MVVNSALWKLFDNFEERDIHQHGLDRLEVERARGLCKRNLDDAARFTPLLLEHSYRQIQALLLLVSWMFVIIMERRLIKFKKVFFPAGDITAVLGPLIRIGQRAFMPRRRLSLFNGQQLRIPGPAENRNILGRFPYG